MIYKDWLINWLTNYVEPSVKHRTYIHYKVIAEKRLLPRLGNMEIGQIRPYELQCFVSDLLKSGNLNTGEGLSPNSVNSIISVLQGSLRAAYSIGLINEYVGDKIKRPKVVEKKVDCFSVLEQKQIESYILNEEKERYFGVLLCLYTGLRIGELLALEWTDIDMNNGELYVNKTCYYVKTYGRAVYAPKTPSSVRTVPIPKQLMPYLCEEKKKSRSTHIVTSGDKPISIRVYQQSFSLLLKRLKIRHRGFHSLRHTFATRALECGMDVKTLSELLGHRSPTVTLNRYAHSLSEHKRKMMNKLGDML